LSHLSCIENTIPITQTFALCSCFFRVIHIYKYLRDITRLINFYLLQIVFSYNSLTIKCPCLYSKSSSQEKYQLSLVGSTGSIPSEILAATSFSDLDTLRDFESVSSSSEPTIPSSVLTSPCDNLSDSSSM